MTPKKSSTEKVSVEEAIQRIYHMCINNAERILKLEETSNQMYKTIMQKHEQLEARTINMHNQTAEMHMKVTSTIDEAKQQLDAIKQQCTEIMPTLNSPVNRQQSQSQNDYSRSTQPVLNIDGHSNNTTETMPLLRANDVKTSKSHIIITPSPTPKPAFAGKCSESPNQFLIHLQEYAETICGWDQSTLLRGISLFLHDTALDWYCQLRASHRRPQEWPEFVSLFMFQFHTPLQNARQEQEWYECKQWENETINEFVIRLRAIWYEQKPKETEVDFIKHLLCKMRNDLFSMMSVRLGASLDDVVSEAQKVEVILYRREQEQRLAERCKQIPYENDTFEYSSDEENAFHQRNKGNSLQETNIHFQRTSDNRSSKKSNSIQCCSCATLRPFFKDCPNNNADFFPSSTPKSYHSENERRVSRRWDVDAHL